MRHERVLDKASYDKVEAPHLCLAGAQVAPLPVGEIEAPHMPTPAAPEVPAAVGGIIVAAYAALIAAFAVATVGSAESVFAVTISALFLVAFFTVPRIFLAVEPKARERSSFDRFMSDGIQTLTGHNSGAAALVQMLIVPVLLTFAALAMGIAAAIYM
ncbi:hypothetical protein [Sphingosinicella sp. YJ22]|uniref:hypothetical protein n=1 Tax=Sphingosinicella sp. YJ22 TaxID=1104780 RepID=UPI0014095654|nr:hypothetical protein [Sphingosinicella sp. YJ22]